jgi:ABC-type transport system involved in multi-copper enzyme maturation permease subunit
MLFSVIIIATSGKVNLAGEDWVRIIMAIFLSILYISIFVTLGLFLSSSLRSSAAGLVILLLAWTLIAVVIPGIGGTITTSLSMLGDRTDKPNPYAAYHNAREEYIARHPDTARWQGGVWGPRDSLGKHIAMWGAFMRVYNSQCDEMVRQVRFGYNIIRISPTVVYRRAVEAVAGSGIDHYESFMKQVRRYGLMLQDCLVSYHPLDIHKQYDDRKIREAFSDVGLTAADVPKFQDKPITIGDSMKNSMWNIAILVVFNVVLFMAAHISFLRQDIR